MLNSEAREVKVPFVSAKVGDRIGDFEEHLKLGRVVLVFEDSKYLGLITKKHYLDLSPGRDEKVERVMQKVEPVDGSTLLYEIARKMVEQGVRAFPILENGEITGVVTDEIVIGAIKATKPLSKLLAKHVMVRPIVIKERQLRIANVRARKHGLDFFPVVNDKGKLIGVWIRGKFTKDINFVRENTRIKIVIDRIKAKGEPVIVIDKWRQPVGIITTRDLLELAASYREEKAPVYYSGFDVLDELTEKEVKAIIEETLFKISKMVPINYAAARLKKISSGWEFKLRVSTPWKMFVAWSDAPELRDVVNEVCFDIEMQVKSEKEKRTKLRRALVAQF